MAEYEVEPSQSVGGAQLSSCKQFTTGPKQGRDIFKVMFVRKSPCAVWRRHWRKAAGVWRAERSVPGDLNSVQASRELDTICQVNYEGHRD